MESPQEALELGICQIYTGKICEKYMGNVSVFITPEVTMELIEKKLAAAASVIKISPDISTLCARFVWYSLCATVLPVCRTPEETNHSYFLNKNKSKIKGFQPTSMNKSKKSNPPKNKKSQKNKSSGIKIIPTESPIVVEPTTIKTRIIDHYAHSNSYYEETHGSRKRRYVDIQFIKNG